MNIKKYVKCDTKFIVGKSIAWPNDNEIVVRVNFALDLYLLINSFYKINILLDKED